MACGGNPWDKIGLGPLFDHDVKAIGECSCGDEHWHAGLDGSNGDCIGLAHVIPRGRHQSLNRSGRGDLLQLLIAGVFGATTPGRPLADHPLGTAKAVGFEPSPQFGGVPTAAGPLGIEQRQTCIERALPCSEYIASIAPKDLADAISTVAGLANDLLDRRTILGECQDCGNGFRVANILRIAVVLRRSEVLD